MFSGGYEQCNALQQASEIFCERERAPRCQEVKQKWTIQAWFWKLTGRSKMTLQTYCGTNLSVIH